MIKFKFIVNWRNCEWKLSRRVSLATFRKIRCDSCTNQRFQKNLLVFQKFRTFTTIIPISRHVFYEVGYKAISYLFLKKKNELLHLNYFSNRKHPFGVHKKASTNLLEVQAQSQAKMSNLTSFPSHYINFFFKQFVFNHVFL